MHFTPLAAIGGVSQGFAADQVFSSYRLQVHDLLQQAIEEQAYDPTRIDFPTRQTPDTDSDPAVRDDFGLSSKFSGITAKITNFYLEDDFATTIWGINHDVNKPQRLDNRLYGYRPSGYTLSDGSMFKLAELSPLLAPITTPPIRGVTKPEEAFAFVTKTRSLPAGPYYTNVYIGLKSELPRN